MLIRSHIFKHYIETVPPPLTTLKHLTPSVKEKKSITLSRAKEDMNDLFIPPAEIHIQKVANLRTGEKHASHHRPRALPMEL